ncbi:MAG: hypothetical protein JWN70_6582, partial [Planctomycetaceae bacterium]|nr:hypothetical protein [Planctomycetaceae bacterium]
QEIAADYPEQHPQPPVCHPADYLIIASRLGDHHWLIRCNDPQESSIWHLSTPDMVLTETDETFVEWLYGWICEAKTVIDSGWYH